VRFFIGENMKYQLITGDCLEKLKTLPDNSIDSIVTDPPYGLSELSSDKIISTMREWSTGNLSFIPKGKGFMGKDWDSFVPPPAVWEEALRVLKPGGYILCFAGTRTVDLMSLSLRIAGFEIRDMIMWVYGSGMPKGLNLSKGIDKLLGSAPDSPNKGRWNPGSQGSGPTHQKGWGETEPFDWEPVSEEARQWVGWNTVLKPALEPIIMARKPPEGSLTDNVLKWGVGGLNIDKCRVGQRERPQFTGRKRKSTFGGEVSYDYDKITQNKELNVSMYEKSTKPLPDQRYPSNFILDGFGAELLDSVTKQASRFFYVPKASKEERELGLEGMELRKFDVGDERPSGGSMERLRGQKAPMRANHHPTVKPAELMQYLCVLVTPENGIVLDPFMGSGSTGIAAVTSDFNFIGIEMSEEYVEIASRRITYVLTNEFDI